MRQCWQGSCRGASAEMGRKRVSREGSGNRPANNRSPGNLCPCTDGPPQNLRAGQDSSQEKAHEAAQNAHVGAKAVLGSCSGRATVHEALQPPLKTRSPRAASQGGVENENVHDVAGTQQELSQELICPTCLWDPRPPLAY